MDVLLFWGGVLQGEVIDGILSNSTVCRLAFIMQPTFSFCLMQLLALQQTTHLPL